MGLLVIKIELSYLLFDLDLISFCLVLSCSSINEESICMEIFEEYIDQLKDQAKENERKRKEEKVLNQFTCFY